MNMGHIALISSTLTLMVFSVVRPVLESPWINWTKKKCNSVELIVLAHKSEKTVKYTNALRVFFGYNIDPTVSSNKTYFNPIEGRPLSYRVTKFDDGVATKVRTKDNS
jgi:hypothetical protein